MASDERAGDEGLVRARGSRVTVWPDGGEVEFDGLDRPNADQDWGEFFRQGWPDTFGSGSGIEPEHPLEEMPVEVEMRVRWPAGWVERVRQAQAEIDAIWKEHQDLALYLLAETGYESFRDLAPHVDMDAWWQRVYAQVDTLKRVNAVEERLLDQLEQIESAAKR